MKFSLSIITTLLGGIGISLISGVPWWGFVCVSFLVALVIHQVPSRAFAAGFLGMFLAWGGLAWWIDWQNASILSKQIASIFPLQGSSAALLMLTSIIGGLLGGVTAITGSYLRMSKNKS